VSEHTGIYQGILAAAQLFNADLIVMGTHGAGALERLIVGSQTQRVLAHTAIPVLVLH
jgi:nucleotide-binding universal stress UspA family protein